MERLVAIGLVLAACGRADFDPEHVDRDGAPLLANVAFATSTTQLPTTFGSDLSGADAICMQRAQAAGLAGSYVALLSTSTIGARGRLAGSRGWVRADGKPVLDLPDDIENGKLYYPIALDESAVDLDGQIVVTGSKSTGDVSAFNCSDYTDPAGQIEAGASDWTSFGWLDIDSAYACNTPARIYCFGLGQDVPLAAPQDSGRIAFASSEPYVVKPGGSIADADALCNGEAQAAQLPGTYLALLATSAASAQSRFSLNGPRWVRRDGAAIVGSALALATCSLDTTINVTATGTYLGNEPVMTGIDTCDQPTGTGDTCSDWSDPTGTGAYGDMTDASYALATPGNRGACTTQPIYCLQQ